ncbi:unnamed protein product [Gulo gulo]|uniref:Uncharacterized protein n=1 Tax=Gulo gulo TaxID=48420 RepID=A0A9X9LVI3_GULGU|nr:unnamed protein product [Gulo gulo]
MMMKGYNPNKSATINQLLNSPDELFHGPDPGFEFGLQRMYLH